jgi:hypothetical protein
MRMDSPTESAFQRFCIRRHTQHTFAMSDSVIASRSVPDSSQSLAQFRFGQSRNPVEIPLYDALKSRRLSARLRRDSRHSLF